jgi:hypothetical protein
MSPPESLACKRVAFPALHFTMAFFSSASALTNRKTIALTRSHSLVFNSIQDPV